MGYNHRTVMVDIYETRRLRLCQLIQERFEGNRTAFARALGFQQPQVIEYANGARTMGGRVADRIEQALKLPTDWLDKQERRRKSRVPLHPLRTVGKPSRPMKFQLHTVKELLAAGYTHEQIARQLGVHRTTISRAVQRAAEKEHKSRRPQRVAA